MITHFPERFMVAFLTLQRLRLQEKLQQEQQPNMLVGGRGGGLSIQNERVFNFKVTALVSIYYTCKEC